MKKDILAKMKKTNNERIDFLKAKIKMCDLIILNNKKEILKRRKKKK